jgi:hypothetical protein
MELQQHSDGLLQTIPILFIHFYGMYNQISLQTETVQTELIDSITSSIETSIDFFFCFAVSQKWLRCQFGASLNSSKIGYLVCK